MPNKPLVRAGQFTPSEAAPPLPGSEPTELLPEPQTSAEKPAEPKAPALNPADPRDLVAMSLMRQGVTLDEARKRADEWLSLKPAERWEKNVMAAGMDVQEAERILDAVLEKGWWEKEYSLYRGRLKLTLRSRDFASNQRVAQAVDGVRTNDESVLYQTRMRTQLACSLLKYKDHTLVYPGPNEVRARHEDAYLERAKFVDTEIQGPVADAVFQALADFDRRTYAALSEGADDGF